MHNQKQVSSLYKENETLLKESTQAKTQIIALEEQMLRKEEQQDDKREAHEAELRSLSKGMENAGEEIKIYKHRLAETQQRIRQAGHQQSLDNKQIEDSIRRRENEFNDARLKMERSVQHMKLRK